MGMGVSGGEEGARNGELRRCRGRCYACFSHVRNIHWYVKKH